MPSQMYIWSFACIAHPDRPELFLPGSYDKQNIRVGSMQLRKFASTSQSLSMQCQANLKAYPDYNNNNTHICYMPMFNELNN